MDLITQKRCLVLIRRLKKKRYKRPSYAVRARNECYELMHPFMMRWMKSTLNKWGLYRQDGELVSWAFDAFLFCLDRYDPESDFTIPGHFSRYTRYWLSEQRKKIVKREGRIQDDFDLTSIPDSCDNQPTVYCILDLESLRDSLPTSYRVAMDDALTSLASGQSKEAGKVKRLSRSRHQEAKRVFKMVVKHLLGLNKKRS